jgi:chromosome segregation ATPase
MMSSRGAGAGSDPITALMNIIGDPEGMTKRLKELKAETDKYNEAFEKAQTRAAEAEERDLISRKNEEALTKRSADLDAQYAEITRRERTLTKREADFKLEQGEVTMRQFEVSTQNDRYATSLADQEARLKAREIELDKREQDQKDRIRVVEAKLEEYAKREEALSRGEQELKAKAAKLRDLFA